MIATAALFALAAGSHAVRAQDVPTSATDAQLDSVEAQYDNAGFNEALPNSQSFNIELDAEALLDVAYGGELLNLGQDYATDAVASMPNIWVTPTSDNADDFSGSQFTLMLADASAVGGPDPEGDFRHYLANGVMFQDASGSDNTSQAIDLSQATVVTEYAAPGPLEGSGTHRYAWLLFEQGDDFSAPEGLASAGAGADHWNVSSYVQESNLGDLVAASFFTVTAEGTASFSEGSTSAAASMASTGAASGSGSAAAASSPAASGSSSNNKDTSDSDSEDSSASSLKMPALAVALGAAVMAVFA